MFLFFELASQKLIKSKKGGGVKHHYKLILGTSILPINPVQTLCKYHNPIMSFRAKIIYLFTQFYSLLCRFYSHRNVPAIMGWTVYEVVANIPLKGEFIPRMLQSVGAIVISTAISNVAPYMIEEGVFMNKELRDSREERRTLTKISVIITIAVSIEGLVFIFKAGTLGSFYFNRSS